VALPWPAPPAPQPAGDREAALRGQLAELKLLQQKAHDQFDQRVGGAAPPQQPQQFGGVTGLSQQRQGTAPGGAKKPAAQPASMSHTVQLQARPMSQAQQRPSRLRKAVGAAPTATPDP
jgi:hypothetical protein